MQGLMNHMLRRTTFSGELNMNAIVFGSGKVAQHMKKILGVKIIDRRECDITIRDQVVKSVEKYGCSVVINCAAKTNLEFCEDNKVESFSSNTLGPLVVADVCKEKNIKLVHISSGCLFDGNEVPMTERDTPSPSVWYTRTKLWADEALLNMGYKNILIVRPRQLISSVEHPSNLLTKFLSMEKIEAIDEDNTVTCIEDFCEMISHLVGIDACGIFNTANTGITSPYSIAKKIKEKLNPAFKVEKISYENLLKKLPNRRVNTVLSVDKIIESGYTPRVCEEAIDLCLENYESK